MLEDHLCMAAAMRVGVIVAHDEKDVGTRSWEMLMMSRWSGQSNEGVKKTVAGSTRGKYFCMLKSRVNYEMLISLMPWHAA